MAVCQKILSCTEFAYILYLCSTSKQLIERIKCFGGGAQMPISYRTHVKFFLYNVERSDNAHNRCLPIVATCTISNAMAKMQL